MSVALGIQHEERTSHIVSAAHPVLKYFSTYLTKGTIFEKKKVIEHKMCFDFLYNFRLKHFSLYEEMREM